MAEMTTKSGSFEQSDDIFRLLVATVVDYAIFALDPNGNIQTWNAGARRLKGYEPNEVIGTHFSRFYTKEDIDRNHPASELEFAKKHGVYQEEGWRIKKNGDRFWASVVITALYDENRVLRGFGKVTRDLTERKMAEEKLRESEERFRLMIEGLRDYAIFMLDPQGRVATWNEGAKRIKGYEAHEIIGEHFSRFHSKESCDAGVPVLELREALANGRYESTGWRYRKDGSRFWANVVITAILDRSGRLLGYTKVTRDLTERKIAEEQLQHAYETLEHRVVERTEELARAKDQAELAVRARDQFLSVASHELKTPLTSLKLQVQMRKRSLTRPTAAQSFSLEKIPALLENDERQIDRLTRLVDDMLDISRIANGKLKLIKEEMDLGQLVHEVVQRHAHQFESIGSELTFESESGVSGRWDRDRLDQVLTNLLTNALKYGAGKPVHVSVRTAGDIALFSVRDRGIGMDPRDHSRIFEQYERAVAPGSIAGLGLGLHIVKQILLAHGGRISVASALGEGSTFTVELPRQTGKEVS